MGIVVEKMRGEGTARARDGWAVHTEERATQNTGERERERESEEYSAPVADAWRLYLTKDKR